MKADDKYWKKVAEALKTIEFAKVDKGFQRWLHKCRDALDFDYDQYAQSCYEEYYMPENFNLWALSIFVGREAWKGDD